MYGIYHAYTRHIPKIGVPDVRYERAHTVVMWNVQTRLIYIVFAHCYWYLFANGKGAYCVVRVSIEYILACTWFVQ